MKKFTLSEIFSVLSKWESTQADANSTSMNSTCEEYTCNCHHILGPMAYQLMESLANNKIREDAISQSILNVKAEAWSEVWKECIKLGLVVDQQKRGMENVIAFIRRLHQQANNGHSKSE